MDEHLARYSKHLYNVFKKYNTDKYLHQYNHSYAKLFTFFNITSILEIGTLHGWSLQAWCEVIDPNYVFGIELRQPMDNKDDELLAQGAKILYGVDSVKRNRVYDPVVVIGKRWFLKEEPRKWSTSLIVDDGAHTYDDQLQTFLNFRGHWKDAYVIEDVIGSINEQKLRSKIEENGYHVISDESKRYTEEQLASGKVKTDKVYMMTVTRHGAGFGNAYS